jgi:hypothetical protein
MPFEYKPFVNRYVGAISDVMGQGAEARNRAALSVAETQAGAVGRLGDLTADRWRGLGQDVVGGVESYFTDKQEAKDREYTERLQAENLLQIAEEADARKRREESRALGVTVARGRDVRSGPGGDQLALETGAGGEFQRTPLGSTRPPSRFRGAPPPGTRRDAEGNLVSAEPALLPAKTVRMNPTPYKAIDTRGLELHDIDKIAQEAMQAGLYEEFLPTLEALEGFNTRRGTRFDEAYADFQGTLKGSLGQPDALMSVAGDAFKHFSSELGGSPRFQALVNAHEAGDPAAFEEMFRRDSNTPIVPPIQLDPELDSLDSYSGKRTAGEREPRPIPFGPRETIVLDDGSKIQGAQAVNVGGQLEWRDPDGRAVSGVSSVVDPVSGGLTPTQLWKLDQDERRFPEAWRQNISREWLEEGATYETAMETVRRLIEELAATDPGAAASVDPALAIAYVGRLYGRPLTPDQVAMMAFLGRRGNSDLEEPPPTGDGT